MNKLYQMGVRAALTLAIPPVLTSCGMTDQERYSSAKMDHNPELCYDISNKIFVRIVLGK